MGTRDADRIRGINMAFSFRDQRLRVVLLAGLAMSVAVPAVTAQTQVKRDLYGDPLPEGAVARMGSMRFRHASSFLVFAPDRKTLIASGGGNFCFWDPVRGTKIRETAVKSWGRVYAATDGKLLATVGEGGVLVLDPGTGRLLRKIEENHDVLAFSPDSKLLATVSRNNKREISLWDPATGKLVRQLSSKEGKECRP
jgi:WD40 repeat protein